MTASKSRFSLSRFPKALAAAGLAAVLVGCGGGSSETRVMDTCPDGQTGTPPDCVDPAVAKAARARMQDSAIKDAIAAAQPLVIAVNNSSTDAQVTAAQAAITAIHTAITAAVDVDNDVKAAHTRTHNFLMASLTAARTARTAAMTAAQQAVDKAMMVTAGKLFKGIKAPSAESPVAYSDGSPMTLNIPAALIPGTIGRNLKEDKKAMVPDLHGWRGKRFYLKPEGTVGTYEAHVYSNNSPVPGKPFGKTGTAAGTKYQYTLNTDGILASGENGLTSTGYSSRVSLPATITDDSIKGSVTVGKAGKTEITKKENAEEVRFNATYHGVMGQYRCAPSGGDGNTYCSVSVAGEGFTLGDGTWSFKPTDPTKKVTGVEPADYASFGWWLHKSGDDNTYTASAFAIEKGTVADAEIGGTLHGSATYTGGAAGKYALSSSTGGTNDAGHFTAKATLTAAFDKDGDDTITGMINEFKVGKDGATRNWSVELKEATIASDGVITRSAANDTVWTLDGTAAVASGEWSGSLHQNGGDGVPKIGIGTFYSHYGTDGKMVGGFGVTCSTCQPDN